MNERWLVSSFTASSLIHLGLIPVAALVMHAKPIKPVNLPVELIDIPRVEQPKKVEAPPPPPPPKPKPKPQNITAPKLLSKPVFETSGGPGVAGGGGGKGISGLGRGAKGDGTGGGGIGSGEALSGLARPLGGYQVKPRYPESARRAGAQGVTLLRVRVMENGRVGEVIIDQSAGFRDLDFAAAEAVKKWLFEPARRGKEAVSVWVLLPVKFELH
jgi:periplasmic protein TonB